MVTPNYDLVRSTMRSDDALSRFKEVIGSEVGSRQYIASVLLAVANSPALQQCTPVSILTAAMRAATLRLSCDPALGQAHLVPFKDKATLVIGYKGLKDMALRTGQYRFLNVGRVYEGQDVVEDQMTGIHTIHGAPDKTRKTIGWMLYFELVSGFRKTVYMTVEEIHNHGKKYSRSYGYTDSPWKTSPEKMEQKTLIRLGLGTWGYFNPQDAQAMSEAEAPEAQMPDDDVVDEPAARERKSENEILTELGYV